MKKILIAFVFLFVLLFIWDVLLKNQKNYSGEESKQLTNEEKKDTKIEPNNTNLSNDKPYNISINNDNTYNNSFKKAVDFTLTSLDNEVIKLSNYKGKIVKLNFWATWCPPCRAEIPSFIELYKKYKEQGLVIIGIAIDEKNKVEHFAKNYKINYPIVIGNEKIVNDYGGIYGLPTTFIIDKEGKIREKFVGYRPKEIFEEAFLKLK